MKQHAAIPYLVLVVGVLIASTAAILIRFAQQDGMPSLTIAAGRLGLAVVLLTPLAWARAGRELRSLQRRDLFLGIGAGVFMAIHFVVWTSSLEYTSVALSTVFVTTNPIWIALASWLLLREHIGPRTIGGIGLSLCGGVLIFMSSSGQGTMAPYENMLLGNTLALLGAITVSGYFLIGRGLRRRLSTLAYIWLAYTTGAGILVLLVLLSGQQVLSFSPLTYLVLLALAVGPQLMGHTAFNWALAHLSATFIALAILGEPIFSAIWAWVLFDERIDISRPDGMMQVAGFLLLLGGIYVAALGERPAKAEVANAL